MQSEPLKQVLSIPMEALLNPLNALWAKLVGFVPNILAVLVIVVLGYVVSALLQRLATAILRRVGFDQASRRVGIRATLDRAGIDSTVSEIVGGLIFWLLMLTFLISAAEALGLPNVSRTIDSFVRYLPNVIGAAVILVVGLMIAHFVRDLVRSGTEGLGLDYGQALGSAAYGILLVVIVSLAVGQLQIETALFNRVVEITLIASGGALALALGLGTREIAKHLVAGVYARELLRTGADLTVAENSGSLEEVGAVYTRLRAKDGTSVYIPNAQLTESVIHQSNH